MNLPVLAAVSIAAIILIIVLVRSNAADRRAFERSENDVHELSESESEEESES